MFGSTDWSDVPGDVWYSVGLKLDAASDRIRFRAVSKSLRSHLPFRQPPWLMLSEIDHDSDSEEENEPPPRRHFVILGEQGYYKFNLPQAHLARCIGSTNTWLITVKADTIIRLLNPFSKYELDLPSQNTFDDDISFEMRLFPPGKLQRDCFLKKAIICPPSSHRGFGFLVIALQYHGIPAMARPGDSFWSTLNFGTMLDYDAGVQDMVVYKGTLFAISLNGLLLSCDIRNYPNSALLGSVVGQPFDKCQLHVHTPGDSLCEILYLVEWCGHLLLVIKFINVFGKDHKTERFQIYKFDFTIEDWIEINSLGEYSLFLGYNTSVSVLASEFFGLVKENCIYFTDDFHFGFFATKGYDMGVFDLDDNSIRPHYQGTSTSLYSPPIWIVPD